LSKKEQQWTINYGFNICVWSPNVKATWWTIGFWKESNKGTKDKIFLPSFDKQKVETQKACQNLIGYTRKLSTKTNLKQIQVRRPCVQKTKYL
jgi:hypothetical protein